MPIVAFGALLAALLETSVLSELSIAGAKPDLVFAVAIVVAMAISFEGSLVWVLVGGLLVDALTGRPLGATALALLI
ncbi:MAG: rod shape-determining protein MreD, partial [Chloroflexi bacterium]|nr:rod shape-determining protein MreD [Chloroflexota bacterium]